MSKKKESFPKNNIVEEASSSIEYSSSILDLLKINKIPLLILFVCSILLYANTITHDYALDDQLAIYDNKYVVNGIAGIKDILTHDAFEGFFGERGSKLISGGRYRPLSFVSFAIEWQFFGKNPMVSHALNIIFYGLLCCSIYLFLLWLFPQDEKEEKSKFGFLFTLPFIAAILYTFHPIHTEVVANIKGRDELLGFLFGVLSLIYFYQFSKGRPKDYFIIFFLFFLSLLSKENSITFILIFPLVAFIKGMKLTENKFMIPYASIIVSTVLFLIIRSKFTQSGIDAYSAEILNNPFVRAENGEKWGTIIYSFCRYLLILIFPHPLTHDYYFNQIPYRNFKDPIVWLTIAELIALVIYTLKNLKSKSPIIFSILFFAITFSIVSNVLFTVGIIMNERFVFISSLGFSIIMGYILLSGEIKLGKNLILGITSLILVLYAGKTISRNLDWKDNFTLFGADYITSHNSAKVSTAFGGVLMEKVTESKDTNIQRIYTDSSIRVLENSLRIYPENSQAILLYGNAVFSKTKDKNQAVEIYRKALEYRANFFDANFNIGILQFNAGEIDSALVYLERAKAEKPEHKETLAALSKIYAKKGRIQEAIQLTGNSGSNLSELALNAKESGNFQEAFNLAEQALATNPNDAKAAYVKGICLARYMNKLQEGIPYLEKALSIDKKNAFWLEDLAVAYGMSGQFAKTIPLLEEVIRQRPNEAAGYRNLSTTYAKLGNMKQANYYMQLAQQKIK